MAVIIPNMDMPKRCCDCDIYEACYYAITDSTSKHPNCTLRSVDEMVAEIKALCTWSRSLGGVTIPYHRVEEIIDKYTDK